MSSRKNEFLMQFIGRYRYLPGCQPRPSRTRNVNEMSTCVLLRGKPSEVFFYIWTPSPALRACYSFSYRTPWQVCGSTRSHLVLARDSLYAFSSQCQGFSPHGNVPAWWVKSARRCASMRPQGTSLQQAGKRDAPCLLDRFVPLRVLDRSGLTSGWLTLSWPWFMWLTHYCFFLNCHWRHVTVKKNTVFTYMNVERRE